ncbi:Uncharacterised protein [Mycobacteroides abscessus subsp. abscessus]|nr:Uncharacterised protein [Mycobacteroides abscessus subsp. abscessus]
MVPHLHGASHQLVPARPLHPVDAQVRPADADRIFRCPGACRVVFGGDEPMSWIDRRCDGRTQVYIAQAQYQV